MATTLLTADTAAYTLDVRAAGNALYADPAEFSVSPQDALLTRSFTVDLDALEAAFNFLSVDPIVDPRTGRPTQRFQHDYNKFRRALLSALTSIVNSQTAIQVAYNAAAQAQTAATEAAATVQEVTATVETVTEQVTGIVSGTTAITMLNVGGTTFVNDGGNLTPHL